MKRSPYMERYEAGLARFPLGRVPKWWLGAPLVGVVVAFLAKWLLPDLAIFTDAPEATRLGLIALTGMVGWVVLLASWQLVRWTLLRTQGHGHRRTRQGS